MNGAVVRHAVGDRRYEGPQAATALAPLYTALPLFVNFFQPSFEISGKRRGGAKVKNQSSSGQRRISGCWQIRGSARRCGGR